MTRVFSIVQHRSTDRPTDDIVVLKSALLQLSGNTIQQIVIVKRFLDFIANQHRPNVDGRFHLFGGDTRRRWIPTPAGGRLVQSAFALRKGRLRHEDPLHAAIDDRQVRTTLQLMFHLVNDPLQLQEPSQLSARGLLLLIVIIIIVVVVLRRSVTVRAQTRRIFFVCKIFKCTFRIQ